MNTPADPSKLLATIKLLGVVYVILFFASLLIIVAQATHMGGMHFGGGSTVAWAVALGGAVAVRLTRNSMLAKYVKLKKEQGS